MKTVTVTALEPIAAPSDEQLDSAITRALGEYDKTRLAVQSTWTAMADAGRLMILKRESLPHGKWERWLDDHIPAIYKLPGRKQSIQAGNEAWYRTARNWMKLADTIDRCPPDALDQPHTIRQLFALAGMLPEGEHAPNGDRPAPLPADIVSRIKRVTGRIREEISGTAFRDWPDELRMSLRTELEPLVELYRELSAV
jgi:hypothetical protein